MELYTGMPYWLIKNPLWSRYHPLHEDRRTTVAIIGSGITGALVAHALCEAGIECCVVDSRSPSTGSSVASTALLQYEIDIPLCRMVGMMPEDDAVTAYRSCLDAIGELEGIFDSTGVDATFERVPSVYYASDTEGARMIAEEYAIRKKHGLPAELLSRAQLRERMGIEAPGALMNRVSAQIDTYKAATGLLAHHMRHHGLELYTPTRITEWVPTPGGYILTTDEGMRIECDYVVVAAGFEAGPFLPEKLMKLTSTFAVISSPVAPETLWPERSLIWETRSPYLYIRTDDSNRIIVGGEDVNSDSASTRKYLLDRKAGILERKFRELFPGIPFEVELKWAGTFSSTRDGLPLIGAEPGNPRMLFALGYGGNGITFSVIASQIISCILRGRHDPRTHVFSLNRPSLK